MSRKKIGLSYSLDTASAAKLRQLHPHLQTALERVLNRYPFRIEWAYRSPAKQSEVAAAGNSQVTGDKDYPHMARPDGVQAVDLRPITSRGPIDWSVDDPNIAVAWAWFMSFAFHEVESYVNTIEPGKWDVVSGLNWDGDLDIATDQNFDDYGHIEIKRIT